MKRFFSYFSLNQIEQRGFIVLLGLIVSILFVPLLLKSFKEAEPITYSMVYLEKSPSANVNTDAEKVNNDFYVHSTAKGIKNKTIAYFNFDPNTIDELSWSKLGFTDKQIKVIMNYRAKGGRFYKKDDLAKIYSISASEYAKLSPYIVIASDKQAKSDHAIAKQISITTNAKDVTNERKFIIDVNESDTVAWKKLKGIGSVLSKRIVKYRESLGGFYSIEQLKEVYGLPTETYDAIQTYLKLNTDYKVQKININTAAEDALAKHPYINSKQAKTIVNYRVHNGNFKNLESLSQIKSLDYNFLRKIEHYLEY